MDRFGLLCRNIYEKKKITQRELAAAMDLSLGTCNHLIRDALADGLIALDPQTGEYSLLKKGRGTAPEVPGQQRRYPGGRIRLPFCAIDL